MSLEERLPNREYPIPFYRLHNVPDGTPIPQNLDGEYGTPGTTLVNRLTNEFESLGVVFVNPPGLVTILVGPPSCEFCGTPPVGGLW